MMKTQQTFSKRSICTCAIVPFLAVMTFCAVFFDAGRAIAAEIKLLAGANPTLRSALNEVVPQFEHSTGHKVVVAFASIVPMKRQIDAGETFDVMIVPTLVDELVKQGKVAAETRAVVARTGLAVGVRKGAARPDIKSVEALKQTLVKARSIGYEATAQSGIDFLEVLDRLGIAQDVRTKLKPYQIVPKAEEVEILIASTSAMLARAAEIDIVGGFPPEIQKRIDFLAGVSTTTKEPEAAKALLRFLLSPTATSVFKAKGFERD